MNHLSSFFEKFTKFADSSDTKRKAIIDVLKSEVGVHIESKAITTRGNEVFLSVSPLVKSLLVRKQSTIIAKLGSKLGNGVITSVR